MITISGKLSNRKAMVILAVSVTVFLTGLILIKAPSAVVLIASGSVAMGLGMLSGVKWELFHEGIIRTITSFLPAILILIAVGMLIGSWIVCGTVPLLIYYGLKSISSSWFLVTSLLLCTVMSVATGTSWGTIGTVGIALMGVSSGLGIPLPYTAGAVVTGAIFGDKLSPLSDTTVLASGVSGVYIFDHIKYMLWTTLPPFIIALVLYAIIGIRVSGAMPEKGQIDLILATLESSFRLNPILLLPPSVILVLVLWKKPALPTFAAGVIIAAFLAVLVQGVSPGEVSKALMRGFSSPSGVDIVDKMLFRGGINSMLGSVLLPIAAAVFGSPLKTIGVVDIMLEKIGDSARNARSFLTGIFLTHSFLFLITSSYYVTFAAMGPMVAPVFDRLKLHRANLSRILEDTGTSFAPIVPWSITGAFVANTLGVGNLEFAIYAPITYLGMVFSLGYIVANFRIASSDEVITREGARQKAVLSE